MTKEDIPAAENSRKKSQERLAQWKRDAISLAKKNASWSVAQIAASIQDSEAGRKRGGRLTYSIGFIARNIRDVLMRQSGSIRENDTHQ